MNSSAKSLKCMGKTERIGPQIVIDMSFNQDIAMRTLRFRKDTQRGQARPEPVHFIVCKSPLRHRHSYRSTVTAKAKRRGFNVNWPPHGGGGHSCNTLVRCRIVSLDLGRLLIKRSNMR